MTYYVDPDKSVEENLIGLVNYSNNTQFVVGDLVFGYPSLIPGADLFSTTELNSRIEISSTPQSPYAVHNSVRYRRINIPFQFSTLGIASQVLDFTTVPVSIEGVITQLNPFLRLHQDSIVVTVNQQQKTITLSPVQNSPIYIGNINLAYDDGVPSEVDATDIGGFRNMQLPDYGSTQVGRLVGIYQVVRDNDEH